MVGLETSFLKKNFQDLSGGQKQRVIIARALLQEPDVLLFDEPLSGVDFETKLQMYELLAMLNDKYKTTIIFVSHEIESVIAKCHRVLCLNKKMHKGCHPLEFAQGNLESCPVLKTEKSLHPIHHHHSLTSQ
jgi:zinc transport system ATP-binding protein